MAWQHHSLTPFRAALPGSSVLPEVTACRLGVDLASGSHVLDLYGEIDLAVRHRLLRALNRLPGDHHPLVIDLTQTNYLDYGSLRLLLEAREALSAHRTVTFRFADTGPVRRLIYLLRLEEQVGLPLPSPPIVFPSRETRDRTIGSRRCSSAPSRTVRLRGASMSQG